MRAFLYLAYHSFMFDTHCHLTSFYDSVHATSFQVCSNPSQFYLAVSTQVSDWLPTIDFAQQNDNVLAAIGLHPWFVDKNYSVDLLILKSLLAEYSVSGLGEIGLDFGQAYQATRTIQVACLESQLQLAFDYQLPVSLHCVKAHNEMISLLKRFPVKGVVHGLGSSIEVAQQYIDLGFKFGVNAVSVRDNAVRYHRLITHFGLQHIVLETDYPNIKLPGLVDSQLNDINAIAKQIACLLKLPVEDVITQTDYNAFQLFTRKSDGYE